MSSSGSASAGSSLTSSGSAVSPDGANGQPVSKPSSSQPSQQQLNFLFTDELGKYWTISSANKLISKKKRVISISCEQFSFKLYSRDIRGGTKMAKY